MQKRIAYVEDDDATRRRYSQMLRDAGFDVTTYASKAAALDGFQRELPDLALLDITHVDERDAGYQICTELRRMSAELPIIFLTSHDGEIDRISGLRLGADDYITKDASSEYIVIRIEALFRRLEAIRGAHSPAPAQHSPAADNAGITLDETYAAVFWHGTRIDLPLTQFWIIRELCRNPGEVRSHRDLMKAANLVVAPNTITAHVKSIRDSFTRVDADFRCIKTERGRGYRWVSSWADRATADPTSPAGR